jgi:hypothetical protein
LNDSDYSDAAFTSEHFTAGVGAMRITDNVTVSADGVDVAQTGTALQGIISGASFTYNDPIAIQSYTTAQTLIEFSFLQTGAANGNSLSIALTDVDDSTNVIEIILSFDGRMYLQYKSTSTNTWWGTGEIDWSKTDPAKTNVCAVTFNFSASMAYLNGEAFIPPPAAI